jgi:hypothetical protein
MICRRKVDWKRADFPRRLLELLASSWRLLTVQDGEEPAFAIEFSTQLSEDDRCPRDLGWECYLHVSRR